ncbi:MAG: hypothetical protein L3I91_01720 [Mycoplasma sp.]
MAFISDKTRSKLVNSVTKYTVGRKVFLITSVILTVVYLFILLASIFATAFTDKLDGIIKDFVFYNVGTDNKIVFTTLGWVMLVTGCVCLVSLLLSIFITFSIPSPHKVKMNIDKLASSAIGGKRISNSESKSKVVKERFSKPTKAKK